MLKINIRRAESEDCENFVRCYLKSYRGLESYAYSSKRDIRSYFRWLMKRDSQGIFSADILVKGQSFEWSVIRGVGFLACDSNWYSRYEGEVCEIHEIFVNPEWRGIGVGSLLMKRAFDYAKEKGKNKVELWVGERNYRAIRFYRKFGFESREKNGCWIRMIKTIRPQPRPQPSS